MAHELATTSASSTNLNNSTPSPVVSRRPSQVMGPPSLPYSPSVQAAAAQAVTEHGQVAAGSGPLRHPKPLTACDLHLMLEKEQEAMVNRLTKELSLIRQQTASVASTASSTSTTFTEPVDTVHSHSPYANTTAYPIASRRHRSSSSLSSYVPVLHGSRSGSVAGIAAPRPSQSRDPSIVSSRRSLEQPPALSSSQQQHDEDLIPSAAGAQSNPQRSATSQQGVSPAFNSSRHEDILHQREELETIKRENEALRRRVRELELSLKKSRDQASTSPHEPSRASETAS